MFKLEKYVYTPSVGIFPYRLVRHEAVTEKYLKYSHLNIEIWPTGSDTKYEGHT